MTTLATTNEPWAGFEDMKAAFENAPSCHHDHELPERLARELVEEAEQWLVNLPEE